MVVATRRESSIGPEDACGTRELWSLEAAVPLATSPAPAPAPAIAAASGEPDVERPVNRLGRWLRERVRRSDDAFALAELREPARPAVPSFRRRRLEAWWSAYRAHVELDEFLRERLARYLAKSGLTAAGLPVAIDVSTGRVVVAQRGAAAPEWLAPYVRANGEPALTPDLERARAEAARAETALDEARERLTAARRELEAAARAPSLAWSDGDATSPYGRPAVPPPWSLAIAAFVAVMVLGNAWQLALPLLAAAGISPAEIAVEASRRPEAVALPLLLALGASACLFIFSALAMRRARELMESLPPRWHAGVHAVAGGVSLVMAAGLSWAILVRGASSGRSRDVTSFLVAMALPLATPPLLSLARRLHQSRAEKARAAAAWDHVHRAAVGQWTRANALANATERECAALEATRAAWAQRYHLLRARAAEVARLAADAAHAEAAELRHLSEEIVRALEADRRAYLDGGRRRSSAGDAAPRSEPLSGSRDGAADAS